MKVLELPKISDVTTLIEQVDDYPVTAREVVEVAHRSRARPSVINFYQAFSSDTIFTSRDDLLARSEQICYLNLEEQPTEEMRAPEDD